MSESDSEEEFMTLVPPPPPEIDGVKFISVYTAVRRIDVDDEYPYLLYPPINGLHKVPHYEYRAKRSPLNTVGTPGDIWIDLEAKQVFFRTRTGWEKWNTACTREGNRTPHPYFPTRYLFYSGKAFKWLSLKTIQSRARDGQMASIIELVNSYYVNDGLGDPLDDIPLSQNLNVARRTRSSGRNRVVVVDSDSEDISEVESETSESNSDYSDHSSVSDSELHLEINQLKQALATEANSLTIASENYEETQSRLLALADELQSSQVRVGELEASRERSISHASGLDVSLKDTQTQLRNLEASRAKDKEQLRIESAERKKLAEQLSMMRQYLGEVGP